MKKFLKTALLVVFASFLFAAPSKAQATNPPAGTPGPSEVVTGTIVERTPGAEIPSSLEIMLHTWDQNNVDQGMLHEQSQPDGTFHFEQVPLQPGWGIEVMAVYQDVTYYSQPAIFEAGTSLTNIEEPIYESTTDLSQVRVNQMHVVFNFATDGLEVKEVYVLSNLGERTIKGALTLEDGHLATLKFPLPVEANYIFFKPEDNNRFVKFSGGFADLAALIPSSQSSQMVVSYLLPYTNLLGYSYTTPLSVESLNFLLLKDSGVTLNGANFSEPESMTLQDGQQYLVYSYGNLVAGENINLTFSGQPNLNPSGTTNTATAGIVSRPFRLAIGGGLAVLGLALIVLGVMWWRRPREDESGVGDIGDESYGNGLDELIARIARLDEAHAHGDINGQEHQQQRTGLIEEAKHLMK
jgi:hypothetical protein